jgi:hypothetical protein
LIDEVKSGIHFAGLFEMTLVLIFDILRELDVVDPDTIFDKIITEFFMPHNVSHHIGVSQHSTESKIPDANRSEMVY